MTQLDRLEALAEGDTWDFETIVEELRNALPDLIRVAQAAKVYRGIWIRTGEMASHQEFKEAGAAVDAALAPLYREVES